MATITSAGRSRLLLRLGRRPGRCSATPRPFVALIRVRRHRAIWLLALGSCLPFAGLCGCGAGSGNGEPVNRLRDDSVGRLRSAFFILRGDGQPPSALMRHRLGEEGSAVTPMAHHARTPVGPIWLVTSTSGQMCLFAGRPPASSCAPGSFALKHGLTVGVVESPADPSRRRFVLYGAVPDRQKRIRVRIGWRPPRVIPVRHGIFALRAREPVVKL